MMHPTNQENVKNHIELNKHEQRNGYGKYKIRYIKLD
jgi:hypothetical protein